MHANILATDRGISALWPKPTVQRCVDAEFLHFKPPVKWAL